MKASVSSYSFSQTLRKGEMTQFDTLSAAHDIGFRAIEFTDLAPKPGATLKEQLAYAQALRAEANRLGMKIVSYTIGADLFKEGDAAKTEIDRLCRQLDVAAALGAPLMRHDVCSKLAPAGAGRSFYGMLPTLARNIREVTAYGQSVGVRTCSENHGFVAQDSQRVESLFVAVGHDNYGLLLDMGNFACVDEDIPQAVSRLAPYAIHAHAKDFYFHPFGDGFTGGIYTRAANRLVGCAVGDGMVPIRQCLAILRRAGYDGYLSVEYEGEADCREGIARSLNFLRHEGVEL